jgi:hypothetical protein
LAFKIQTLVNHQEESIQLSEYGESLESAPESLTADGRIERQTDRPVIYRLNECVQKFFENINFVNKIFSLLMQRRPECLNPERWD